MLNLCFIGIETRKNWEKPSDSEAVFGEWGFLLSTKGVPVVAGRNHDHANFEVGEA